MLVLAKPISRLLREASSLYDWLKGVGYPQHFGKLFFFLIFQFICFEGLFLHAEVFCGVLPLLKDEDLYEIEKKIEQLIFFLKNRVKMGITLQGHRLKLLRAAKVQKKTISKINLIFFFYRVWLLKHH